MASSPVGQASFTSFESSPLWTGQSGRRQRWWFADGVWLNQQQLSAPVSFALTHWCADRGLLGPDFDEAFAFSLHRDINRTMGNAEDADTGEQTTLGIAVLA